MSLNYHFIFVPAADEMVDDEYQMKTPDFQNTNFAIQCCPYAGGYSVNEYEYENGKLVAMIDHGTFRSLQLAQSKAVALHEKQGADPTATS
jgi:hypothetical protein